MVVVMTAASQCQGSRAAKEQPGNILLGVSIGCGSHPTMQCTKLLCQTIKKASAQGKVKVTLNKQISDLLGKVRKNFDDVYVV